jgi:putative ABC transport system permease protein
MFALMIVFFVVAALIAVVALVSAVASVVSVVHALLPVAKVPVRYNFRNLQVRWLTSLATACAFTVVIFLLTFMLAFVKGMDRLTESSGRAGNVMILSDGATDESFSNLPPASIEELPSDMQSVVMRGPDGKYLATKEVYVIVTHTIPNATPGGRQRRFVQMRGLNDVRLAADVHQIELGQGEWFTSSGVREVTYQDKGTTIKATAPEVVLGNGVAKTFGADLGKPTLLPGDVVEIGPRRWYVSGIMKESNSSFGSEIWALDTHVQETFGRRNSYSSFVVRTKEEHIGSEAAKKLKENRSGQRSYNAQTEQEYFAKMRGTNDQFRYAIIFVAIILAVGGVLGVMNTMFAAISQRTKDIGVMRLLGFTRFQILCSFLLESLLIALVGGVLGCALGLLFDGTTVSSIVSSGAGGGGKSVILRMTVDLSVLISAGILTFFMGAVGGFIPSVSAMRLKPLESLR